MKAGRLAAKAVYTLVSPNVKFSRDDDESLSDPG